MDLRMLIPIFGILLVMIPVAGLTFGLTLRLAVKPFVETLARALRESRHSTDPDQILLLREEVESLLKISWPRNAIVLPSSIGRGRQAPDHTTGPGFHPRIRFTLYQGAAGQGPT